MITLSCQEWMDNPARVQQLSLAGPVFITESDRVTHVVLSWAAYQQLPGIRNTLFDRLSCDVEADPAVVWPGVIRPAKLE